MFRELGIPRSLIAYGICIPLALFIGYLMATPDQFTTIFFVCLCLMTLVFPLLLKWHHFLVVTTWNAAVIVFFLPGQPTLGIAVSILSTLVYMLNRSMHRETTALRVPSVSLSLVCLTGVILGTAFLTGGLGSRVLGAETWGMRRYFNLLGAILGYFAITSCSISKEKRYQYTSLFFLAGTTFMVSDVIYAAGPTFYFLFVVFPSNLAGLQATSQESVLRFSGFTWAALSVIYWLLMRFGIRGVFELRSPWRIILFLAMIGFASFGGFRSSVIIVLILVFIQFFMERLYRTHLLPVMLVLGVLIGALVITFVHRLPQAVQRSLSFLPLDVDPVVKNDAMGTLDWRLQMWKVMLPEIPKYLWLGKGFSFSGTDLLLTQEAMKRGFYGSFEDTLVTGNYHNGILTTLIPFGALGMGCFLWFCWVSLRILFANYRYGDPEIRSINTFLFTFFLGRLLFFLVFYGQFDLDLCVFTGVIGLSVILNGGVCSPAPGPRRVPPAGPGAREVGA